MRLDLGTVVLVDLDPTLGHEQKSVRPCVVVSDPLVSADQRYPLVAVVPLTGTPGRGALYPMLPAGSGGLRKDSWALTDQVRSIDKRRVVAVYRTLGPASMEAVDEGLRLFLGLAPSTGEG
ncbi:MAG: type II toxin-antitoxin system PemK/MazF family toxin [Acidobacteria bacterium]|nr:MAG: type II toxin-antitoxin system PemK/MazF family toxin [Acidobacteriota bacterium]MCE7958302.1 type II toxin-antitoxin system PemK/MazF family toxin [Acidobacteria bacterium ACB2]